MLFLGIDFGWTSQPSGLAALEWAQGKLACRDLRVLRDPAEIIAWVDATAGSGPAMVAIDAPTVIPNATGMRLADRLTHSLFGRYHAGCYPANLARPFAKRTLALSAALLARGFRHADRIVARRRGRYQIEVFPHIAIVQLFGLERILKYKKGSLAQRRAGLTALRELLLDGLPHFNPPVGHLRLPETPCRGRELKALEDQLDALVCAYVGALWWRHGERGCQVLGNAAEGYIIAPRRNAAAGCSPAGAPAL